MKVAAIPLLMFCFCFFHLVTFLSLPQGLIIQCLSWIKILLHLFLPPPPPPRVFVCKDFFEKSEEYLHWYDFTLLSLLSHCQPVTLHESFHALPSAKCFLVHPIRALICVCFQYRNLLLMTGWVGTDCVGWESVSCIVLVPVTSCVKSCLVKVILATHWTNSWGRLIKTWIN